MALSAIGKTACRVRATNEVSVKVLYPTTFSLDTVAQTN